MKGVVTEEKQSSSIGYHYESNEVLEKHFNQLKEKEKVYFKNYLKFPETDLLEIDRGQISDGFVQDWIDSKDVDLIVVFGTSIIKSKLVFTYHGRIINLHLGLSPYYRGSGTNIWPFYYSEPECIGATFHLITQKIDGGAILFQLRPEIKKHDDIYEIGNKTIFHAGMAIGDVLKAYFLKRLIPKSQIGTGKICLKKNFNEIIINEIFKNFSSGMIKHYLDNKIEKDHNKPIINTFE